MNQPTANREIPSWKTVKAEFEDCMGWVTLNRPGKCNAMSPTLNREMLEVLDFVERDDRRKIMGLTGAGDSFSAGMELKEYCREPDGYTAQRRRPAGAHEDKAGRNSESLVFVLATLPLTDRGSYLPRETDAPAAESTSRMEPPWPFP